MRSCAAAHTLKSSSQQLGATSLGKILLELEKAGKENKFENTLKPLEEAKILYEKVKESLESKLA